MRARTKLLIWLVVLAALLGASVGGAERALHAIDMNAVKARLIAEVQLRTGRALALDNLRLHILPDLQVDADNFALANPAGCSRPAMLTASHLTARIALLPLLRRRVIVTDLTLHGAELVLERPPEGSPNWVFATGRPSASLARAQPAISLPKLRLDRLTLLGLTYDGSIGWRTPHGTGHLPIARLTLREVNDSSTISLALAGRVGGDAVQLTGQFGGQNHLWHPDDSSPWPVSIQLSSADGTMGVAGTLTAPDTLSGYDLTLTADGPDIGKLFAAWPGLAVPRLADLHLTTELIDRSARGPEGGPEGREDGPGGIDMPRLALTAGASDLSDMIEGLSLDRLAIAAPNIDGGSGTQRNRIDATGRYAGQELTIAATLGPIGRLFGRGETAASSPIALDAALNVAGAALAVRGRVAPSGDWSGTDVTLDARIPDLSLLSPLARRKLPRWQGIALHGAAVARGGQLIVRDVALSAPVARLVASGTAWLGGRPRAQGTIHAAMLDLDAIGAAWLAARPPTPMMRQAGTPPDAAADDGWIIPDRPLPRLAPAGFDADLSLSADAAHLHGVDLRNLAAHAVLTQGQLAIDPVAADIGTAHLAGLLRIDGSATPAGYAVKFTAPGLDAGEVLALLGWPAAARGRLDLDADLTAIGTSPHALASTLDGYVGIAFTNGAIDNALLAAGVNRISPAARFGLALPGQGQSDVACLATRLDIRQGVAVPAVFLLDTARLRLAAAGAVDLGQERFALRLRPYLVLGHAGGLVLPSRADGPWQAPRLTLEASRGAPGAGSLAAGMVAPDSALGAELGDLANAADASLALADTGDCSQAIAAATDTSGTAPSLPPLPPQAARPVPRSPLDLLKQLLKFAPHGAAKP